MKIDREKLYGELVEDILGRDIPMYNNLYIFVHNLVYGKIVGMCNTNNELRVGRHADDIMQIIQIRIVKKCEDSFFKPVDGKTEKTCEEFEKWCHTVAKNCFKTYYAKIVGKRGKNGENGATPAPKNDDPDNNGPVNGDQDISLSQDDNHDEEEVSATDEKRTGRPKKVSISDEGNDAPRVSGGYEKIENREFNRNKLKECFEVVLQLNSKPHIVLTWLCLSLMMLNLDMRKIDATHMLIKTISEMTLRGMMSVVMRLLSTYKIITVDDDWKEKQLKKLELFNEESGKKIGDMKYSDFFMMKGAEGSISDWFNKISGQIRKNVDPDWGCTKI